LQLRPDLENPLPKHVAEMGTRLYRKLAPSQPLHVPVHSVLAGRRNNPPDKQAGIRSLAVYGPIHYQELPELFMDYIASLTGKSPSTTGAGSEGALTKGPFNALRPTADLIDFGRPRAIQLLVLVESETRRLQTLVQRYFNRPDSVVSAEILLRELRHRSPLAVLAGRGKPTDDQQPDPSEMQSEELYAILYDLRDAGWITEGRRGSTLNYWALKSKPKDDTPSWNTQLAETIASLEKEVGNRRLSDSQRAQLELRLRLLYLLSGRKSDAVAKVDLLPEELEVRLAFLYVGILTVRAAERPGARLDRTRARLFEGGDDIGRAEIGLFVG
jgi:hypothetical protein